MSLEYSLHPLSANPKPNKLDLYVGETCAQHCQTGQIGPDRAQPTPKLFGLVQAYFSLAEI